MATSVALTACGGGGGANTIAGDGANVKNPNSFATAANAVAGRITNSVATAAISATKISGSVIQKENNTANIVATKESINFKGVAFSTVVNSGGIPQDVDIVAGDRVGNQETAEIGGGVSSGGIDLTASIYQKTVSGGEFNVIGRTAVYGTEDDSYLSYGLWSYIPTTAIPQGVGTYLDGGDPFTVANIAGLSGTAQYLGTNGANAVYSTGITAGDTQLVTGDVTLMANFDANTISGTIDNLTPDDGTTASIADITLSPITFSTSAEGGFATGTTSGISSSRGIWAVQFHGNGANPTNKPEFAAGTFSDSNVNTVGPDAATSIFGTFIAKKQP